jgi:hypothetical protein
MASLPFSISVYAGLAKANGLVRQDGNALVLEFEIKDRALGMLRSDLKELRVPIQDIEQITLKTNWFRPPRLIVQTGTMRISRQVPGSRHGTFELTIDHDHQLAAKNLISRVEIFKANGSASPERPVALE